MYIDELKDSKLCWNLWSILHRNPVKSARVLFPDRPKGYVKATHDLKLYLANRGTALGIKADPETRKKYCKIAAEIYADMPPYSWEVPMEAIVELITKFGRDGMPPM